MNLKKVTAVIVLSMVHFLTGYTVLAAELPTEYIGVTINQTQQQAVIEQLGSAKLQDIPYHEYEQGYCYSSNGTYAILSANMLADGYAVNHISIFNQNPDMSCQMTTKTLPICIGEFCLGMSRSRIETMLGMRLTQQNNDADDYVAVFDSTRAITEDERQFALSDSTKADVSYYITFNFSHDKAKKISIMMFETY
ncbi:hypothetical protein [Photobacterium nomapromontoriensis]|uniref:hypothetical protein n=1 Tax=Photobacterium nomapromontoriensis TaxID=2910237 RepID=UPI003D0D1505